MRQVTLTLTLTQNSDMQGLNQDISSNEAALPSDDTGKGDAHVCGDLARREEIVQKVFPGCPGESSLDWRVTRQTGRKGDTNNF